MMLLVKTLKFTARVASVLGLYGHSCTSCFCCIWLLLLLPFSFFACLISPYRLRSSPQARKNGAAH